MVGNDKTKSLPDFVAVRLPIGLVRAAAESDAAKVGFRSKAMARAGRNLDFVIVSISEPILR